jgi:hypothetical protein
MIFKCVCKTSGETICVFRSKCCILVYAKISITTGFKTIAKVFAGNWRKSTKIVIITLIPCPIIVERMLFVYLDIYICMSTNILSFVVNASTQVKTQIFFHLVHPELHSAAITN